MKFEIEAVRERAPESVDYYVQAFDGPEKVAAFYAVRVDSRKGWLSVLQQITADAPDRCHDFDVTHARWAKDGTPYMRRCSEWKGYCPHHIGIGFTGYHVGYLNEGTPEQERIFECTYCGCRFPESSGIEVDRR
jgi:hypothetical protein